MTRAERLIDQYWRAQARIGARAQAQALISWATVNPLTLPQTGGAWVSAMLAVLRGSRGQSQRAAVSFYRLYRAMETGYTLAAPPDPAAPIASVDDAEHEPDATPPGDVDYSPVLTRRTPAPEAVPTVTMGELRRDWEDAADLPFSAEPDDGDVVEIEPFDWPEIDQIAHDRAAVVSLAGTGPARVEEVVQTATRERRRLDDPGFLADLESAGRHASAAADREAIRSGRDIIDRASQSDTRVRGWARVTDGDPCAFCAMLASRGAIYTSRERAALGGRAKPKGSPDGRNPKYRRPPVSQGDLRKYHPMCHCQMMPIYDRNDFLSDEARSLSQQWDEVAGKLSGDDARRAWRRHIEAQRRTRAAATNAELLQRAQEAYRNG